MELYRVLLVDDEEDIRSGISQKMQWEELGFTLVGEADNGRAALELAESLKPDVVLTDIRMPFMDGLELCGILKDSLPATRFVVFSGFDDFEYAKKAVSLNVFEYILKPVSAQELKESLQRLRQQLETERTQRSSEERLRRQYEENLPLLRELFYTRLLDGRVHAGQETERAQKLEVELTGDLFAAVVAHMASTTKNRELAALSLRDLLEESLELSGLCAKVFHYNETVAVLAGLSEPFSVYDLTSALDRVCTLAANYLGLTVTMGVGVPVKELKYLPRSTEGARSALDYRSLVGAGRAIYIGDVEPEESKEVSFGEAEERALTAAIKLGGEAEVRREVAALMLPLAELGTSLSQCNLFFLELMTCLLRLTRGAGLKAEEVFGQGFSGAVKLGDFSGLAELEHWCIETSLRLQSLIRRRRTDSTGHLVEKAKAFIAANYGNSELSVEMLCEHLHLSPAYFSTLFKKAVGMSFTAYVTVVRMEAAAEALRNTEEKTYLIAHACGYDDPNYFSYVFRRHFGMSPTKFRAN